MLQNHIYRKRMKTPLSCSVKAVKKKRESNLFWGQTFLSKFYLRIRDDFIFEQSVDLFSSA